MDLRDAARTPAGVVGIGVAARRLGREAEAARFVSVLRTTTFRSVERVRNGMKTLTRVEPWGSAFLADLQAAGLPER